MRTAIWVTATVTIVLTACAPGVQRQDSGRSDTSDAPRQSRTLVMASRYEPASLASKPLRESGSGVSSTTRLFNAELDFEDGRAGTRPYLAEALPQLNSDSWRVFPDGRMETTYRLRPNATWHDGTLLSAEDFVFAWQVFTAPALAAPAGPPVDQMEEPYDGRRAEQLMSEAGFGKDRDGFFASGAGDRFGIEVWTHTSPQYEKEIAILADSWQRAGFEIKPTILSAAALRDNQLRSSFPALYIASSSRLESFATASIPTPANRWTGSNRGGWVSSEYDRLWQAFNATLDGSQRIGQMVQMLKLLSDEVPSLVLYYNPSIAAHLAVLQGPDSASLNTDVWNIHEWELR